jgi:hypothetical protein
LLFDRFWPAKNSPTKGTEELLSRAAADPLSERDPRDKPPILFPKIIPTLEKEAPSEIAEQNLLVARLLAAQV